MAHGFAPNGGGSYVNQYTLIMDVMFPDTATARLREPLADEHGQLERRRLVREDGAGVGISGTYAGSVTDGVWHRFALVVDLVAGTFTSYVDGVQAMQITLAEERT